MARKKSQALSLISRILGDRSVTWLKPLALIFATTITALSIFRLIRVSSRGGNDWITGDWLIRYADGYVRRGLLGEVAWSVSTIPGLQLIWVVTAMQVLTFGTLAVFSVLLYVKSPPRLSTTLLFVSPAFLAFHFWDFQGGFRKEIFVLAVFAALLWWSTKSFARRRHRTVFLTCWALAPAIFGFVHEAMVFYAPLMLISLWLVGKRLEFSPTALGVTSVFGGILASIPVGLSLVYPGGEIERQAICNSVTSAGFEPNICGAAIGAIAWPLDQAIQVVADAATPLYLWLAAIALAPFVLLRVRRSVIISTLLATTALVPIFIVGADWGRWIHIFIAIATLTIFRLLNDQSGEESFQALNPLAGLAVAGVYTFGWHIPHFAASRWGPEILNIISPLLRGTGYE